MVALLINSILYTKIKVKTQVELNVLHLFQKINSFLLVCPMSDFFFLYLCLMIKKTLVPLWTEGSGWTPVSACISLHFLCHNPTSEEEAEADEQPPESDGNNLAWEGRGEQSEARALMG